jgi:dihydrofolate reductase
MNNNNNKVTRKLKLQVSISVDGCIAGPNNEMNWLISDDEIMNYIEDLADSVDTILMGRKMVDDFISYWSSRMNKRDDFWNGFAKKMIEIPKIVFTKTLTKSNCINTEIAKGDLKDFTKLKSQNGKDMLVYGGASFNSSLIKEKLIDEFYLFINPVAIGKRKDYLQRLKRDPKTYIDRIKGV